MKLFQDPKRSQWIAYVQGLSFSAQSFYAHLNEEIKAYNLTDVKFSTTSYGENRGPFSARREYFRIKRKGFYYDICGFPFGNTFIYSYRAFEKVSLLHRLLLLIPYIGLPLVTRLRKITFQQEDKQAVFMAVVPEVINLLIKEQIKTNGLRTPQSLAEKPIQFDLKGRRI